MKLVDVKKNNPWSDLVVLLAWTLACSIVIQLLIVIGGALFKQDLSVFVHPEGSKGASIFHYIMLGGGSIGTFLLPAYIFQRMHPSYVVFPHSNWADWRTYLLSILFLLAISPCMALVAEWNMQMKLPEMLHGTENWMRSKEDMMAVLMEQVIMIKTWDRLFLNILVVGFLAALSEEFFFRGALLHIFLRIFKNEHLAIWFVAIVFSAIHLQFYGFFPRFFLGLFFGYFVLWTKNIWTAIFAHFINNSSVVIIAFYYARQNKSYAELMENDSYSRIVYLGSFILSIVIAYLFFLYVKKNKIYGERLD